ncbi:MAG: PIG-L deacetylase family protein [Candidatus Thorarchaeota archaeon]
MTNKLNVATIIAHPDDLTFFAAGTIARWAEEGHQIFCICCTHGEVGSLRRDITKKHVAEKREKELDSANKILGIKEKIMLDYPDAGFIRGEELRKDLVYYIRKLKIDQIVTFDPWVKYEVHPNHVIVGRMAAEAGAFSSFPLLYEDQLGYGIEPYMCSEVWFMGLLGHKPNAIVDISQTMEKKIQAALQFDSTIELLGGLFGIRVNPNTIIYDKQNRYIKNAIRLLQSIASTIGKKYDIKFAEAFYVQKILPGHFNNFQEILSESLGNPLAPPKIFKTDYIV